MQGYGARMVTVLKRRLAMVALVGVLVIPILTVNNQGLSHLLFCEATVEEQFAIGSDVAGEPPPVTSSTSLDADEPAVEFEGAEAIAEVCAGVRASLSAIPSGEDRVQLTVTIINDSSLPWQGSVGLAAEGAANSADLTAVLGEVPAGAEESATIELRVLPGQTEINGTLLLGP